MIKFLYVVAVIIGFASTAYSIRCNVCTTAAEADCGDPFNAGNTYDIDCNTLENPMKLLSSLLPNVKIGPSAGCLKVKFEYAGKAYINRSCYWGDTATSAESCKLSGKLLPSTITPLACDVCTEDLCNSSTSTGIFAATLVFLVVIVRLIS